jgi:hypothetical protein
MMKDLSKKETPGANRLHGQYSGANARESPQDVKRLLNFDDVPFLLCVRRSTTFYDGAPKERTP